MSNIDTSPIVETSPRRVHWITWLAVLACAAIYLGLASEKKEPTWESLARWGASPGAAIWNGAYWPLVTSVFVHVELWHVAANVYWLWVFGRLIERRLGAFRYLLFFTASAFVSSSFELAVSDGTGIGASGVVYAMYGLLLPMRSHWREAKEALPTGWIAVFNMWLVGCILVDYLDIYEVGNAAHCSGLAFGLFAAGLILPQRRRASFVGLFAMTGAAALFLAWCPWSVVWLSNEAFKQHSMGNFREAIRLYTRVVAKSPTDAWAYENRARAFQSIGRDREAEADMGTVRRLSSSPK